MCINKKESPYKTIYSPNGEYVYMMTLTGKVTDGVLNLYVFEITDGMIADSPHMLYSFKYPRTTQMSMTISNQNKIAISTVSIDSPITNFIIVSVS